VYVSARLRPDAATSPDRLFCHLYGCGKNQAQLNPGWPYSFIAALELGRTSWTAILDAVRLGPADDVAEVTAAQVRDVMQRLIAARQWVMGDPHVLVVFDARLWRHRAGACAGHLGRPTGLSAVLTVVSGSLGTKSASDERCNPYVGG